MAGRLMVIADDLTGAIDTGVQFSKTGVSTLVTAQDLPHGEEPGDRATVLVVDIESRHLPPRKAAARVERCVAEGRRAGIQLFYKKTDSTLRGNVGAELEALLRAGRGRLLFFVPALPAAGRVTRGGVQLVNGMPVHRSGSVASVIGLQSDVAVVCVPRGADPAPLLAGAPNPAIVVFDAETDGDLEQIARRLAALSPPLLLAGCAGLASALPQCLALPGSPAPLVSLRPPLLLVCGSRNSVSRSQLREAEAHGVASWQAGAIDVSVVCERLRKAGIAILKTPDADSSGSTALLVRLAREVWRKVSVGTIAAFGGDTAFAVLRELKSRGVVPVHEICQGTVACRLCISGGPGIDFITKAGGFGPVDVIQRIQEALRREE
jgi:D-threonate/D-erythronate kinase